MIKYIYFAILAISKIKEITIVGTNDLHGKLMGNNKTQGGLSLFSSYLNIIR